MKGFLVVDRINDVHFIDADDEFTTHINIQAIENGLLQPSTPHNQDLDPNVIMQLFSPLFMSQWFLIEQRKNPCSSITCQNGFIFAFKQYEDFLIVAVNGDGSESEQFLHKKISIFIRMSEFSFGPVPDEIGKCKFCHRGERWRFLRKVLSAWSTLHAEEHSFLVEAVERLHVNQLLNEKCMELLEYGMVRFQTAGEKNTQHAMLIANNKLLSLFSNRSAPPIQESDVLCIILLVKLFFPSGEKLDDYLSSPTRKSEERKSTPASVTLTPPVDRYESAIEGEESEMEEQYLSAADEIPSTKKSSANPYPAVSEHSTEEAGFQTPNQTSPLSFSGEESSRQRDFIGRRRSRTLEDVHVGKSRTGRITPGVGRARSRSLNDQSISIEDLEAESTETRPIYKRTTPPKSPVPSASPYHVRHTAFLTTELCQYSPYQLHFIQIFPGMVLVLISEIPRGSHANSLCQLLRLIKDLLSGQKDKVQRAQGHMLYDIINILLNKLASAMKKARGNLENILNDIRRKWDNAEFKTNLLIYLEQSSGSEIPPGIERSLNSLHKMVKELFLYLYLYPYEITPQLKETVEAVCERSKVKIWDYKDYLSLTAPSLNITTGKDAEVDPTMLMKNKIWKITGWFFQKLASGVTMVTAREGDYYFSYFLWFEDLQGHNIAVHQPYQSGDLSIIPGILSGNFYKALKRHCFPNAIPGSINCYELIMMHIGLVHTQYITDHYRKLSSMLYQSSDASTINLVW
ncbi:hypothetical protein FSP39_003816 [Pinctada imbricata]|uniref:FUZ/MON1/HPS1 first Longin domain-containing protein n=1 Tax=Pinctada imbricata TaxID=66713 RepID=A0AA88XZ35_PINIB|nr:hypothetical protein FSP39_003816 [Pinctada imbricata]